MEMISQCLRLLTQYSNEILVVIELVGVILVVITLYKDKEIKQAEFITEYNFQFISSPPLIEMERKLENCYQVYKTHVSGYESNSLEIKAKEYESTWNAMVEMIQFGPVTHSSEPVTKKYQELINYLVYLESFAPLVLNGQVNLKEIDDIFGYRYLIAMNNPVVQKYELLQEADYYCGCIKLYKKWVNYRKKNKKPIPMEWFSLSNVGNNGSEINPVYLDDEGQKLREGYIRIAGKR